MSSSASSNWNMSWNRSMLEVVLAEAKDTVFSISFDVEFGPGRVNVKTYQANDFSIRTGGRRKIFPTLVEAWTEFARLTE